MIEVINCTTYGRNDGEETGRLEEEGSETLLEGVWGYER